MTNSDLKRDNAVVMSSTMPSAKYSCSGSPDIFWNGRTAIDGLSEAARASAAQRAPARLPWHPRHGIRPDRFFDVLDLLRTKIGERYRQNLPDLLVGRAGDTHSSRLRQRLQPRRNVHPVPEQITRTHHHVTNVNADAKVDALLRRQAGVCFRQRRLRFHRALHGVHGAPELRENTVARGVRDAASVVRDGLVEDRASLGQPLERSDLVGAHEAAIAFDVSREDRHQASLDVARFCHWMPLCPPSRAAALCRFAGSAVNLAGGFHGCRRGQLMRCWCNRKLNRKQKGRQRLATRRPLDRPVKPDDDDCKPSVEQRRRLDLQRPGPWSRTPRRA